MRNLIVISNNIQPKKYNVDLYVPDSAPDKTYWSIGKEFGVSIETAHKEAKRLADIYNASIDDRTAE